MPSVAAPRRHEAQADQAESLRALRLENLTGQEAQEAIGIRRTGHVRHNAGSATGRTHASSVRVVNFGRGSPRVNVTPDGAAPG